MKQFAVAFTTTGNSPKDGHRFSEIVLLGQENGTLNGQIASFKLAAEPTANGGMAFPAALAEIKVLVGDAELIVHNAGSWRRFLRVELKHIKRHGAADLLNKVIEVNGWAHQRFPRQRKDVASIARQAGIEIPTELAGLELEAELLRRIANVMAPPASSPTAELKEQLDTHLPERNWVERIGNFWRSLRGAC